MVDEWGDDSDLGEPLSDSEVEAQPVQSAIQWQLVPVGGTGFATFQAVWVSQIPAGTVIDLTGEDSE